MGRYLQQSHLFYVNFLSLMPTISLFILIHLLSICYRYKRSVKFFLHIKNSLILNVLYLCQFLMILKSLSTFQLIYGYYLQKSAFMFMPLLVSWNSQPSIEIPSFQYYLIILPLPFLTILLKIKLQKLTNLSWFCCKFWSILHTRSKYFQNHR